ARRFALLNRSDHTSAVACERTHFVQLGVEARTDCRITASRGRRVVYERSANRRDDGFCVGVEPRGFADSGRTILEVRPKRRYAFESGCEGREVTRLTSARSVPRRQSFKVPDSP